MKRNRFTTIKLITSGALGVLMTLISVPGSLLAVAVGVPGAGAILNGFVLPFFVIFSLLLINTFGASTIVGGIYGLLLLPTPITGPPGMIAKVFLWLVAGFIGDVIWSFFKERNKRTVVITSALLSLATLFLFVWVVVSAKIPGGDIFAGFAKNPLFLIGIAVWGVIGGYSGWVVYQRLKNTTLTKRVQK